MEAEYVGMRIKDARQPVGRGAPPRYHGEQASHVGLLLQNLFCGDRAGSIPRAKAVRVSVLANASLAKAIQNPQFIISRFLLLHQHAYGSRQQMLGRVRKKQCHSQSVRAAADGHRRRDPAGCRRVGLDAPQSVEAGGLKPTVAFSPVGTANPPPK